MLIHQEKLQLITQQGEDLLNTKHIMGLCYQVIVKPLSSLTQYDITIQNADGLVVYERTSEIGTLSELLILPIRGIYTISINNSTNDEVFNIELGIQE